MLSPGIALSGSMPQRAASQPSSTSAKNGTVTAKTACIGRVWQGAMARIDGASPHQPVAAAGRLS